MLTQVGLDLREKHTYIRTYNPHLYFILVSHVTVYVEYISHFVCPHRFTNVVWKDGNYGKTTTVYSLDTGSILYVVIDDSLIHLFHNSRVSGQFSYTIHVCACAWVCWCVCGCGCVCACMRARVRACVCVCT